MIGKQMLTHQSNWNYTHALKLPLATLCSAVQPSQQSTCESPSASPVAFTPQRQLALFCTSVSLRHSILEVFFSPDLPRSFSIATVAALSIMQEALHLDASQVSATVLAALWPAWQPSLPPCSAPPPMCAASLLGPSSLATLPLQKPSGVFCSCSCARLLGSSTSCCHCSCSSCASRVLCA